MTNFLLCLIASTLWMIAAPEREGKTSGGGRIVLASIFLSVFLWGGLTATMWGYGEFSQTVTLAGGLEAWVEEILAESAELTASASTDVVEEIPN